MARVVKGGPGDKGGLEAGDVITAVNGKPVKADSDVVNAVGLMKPGSRADMSILRQGKKRNVSIVIEAWPEDLDEQGSVGGGSESPGKPGKATPFGMSVSKVSPALRERFRFESDNGVVVTDVKPDSPAARAGLQPGDVILQANNKPVKDPDTFAQIAKEPSARMLLRIERGGQYFFVPLRK